MAAAGARRCATRRATPCSTRRSRTPPTRWARELAGLRAVPVPVDAEWHLDLACGRPGRRRPCTGALAQRSGQPHRRERRPPDEMQASVAWARERGVIVASDECYAEFTYDDDGRPAPPVTALSSGADGVLAVHSLSKRSNMAGLRVGFVAGDPDLVRYLGEMRKHGGLIVPSPVQAAAVAALGDDEHVDEQRARYAAPPRSPGAGTRVVRARARRRAICASTSGCEPGRGTTAGRSPARLAAVGSARRPRRPLRSGRRGARAPRADHHRRAGSDRTVERLTTVHA